MPLSRQVQQSYRNMVDTLADEADRICERAIIQWVQANPDATPEEILDATVDIIASIHGTLGPKASYTAQAFVDALRQSVDPLQGEVDTSAEFNAQHVRHDVAKHVNSLKEGKLADFARNAAISAGDSVNYSANTQMLKNSGHDVAFARVPSGTSKVCPYCVDKAALGIRFPTRDLAEFKGWHSWCRCKIMPCIDGEIEGYDQHAYEKLAEEIESINGSNLSYAKKQALIEAREDEMGVSDYSKNKDPEERKRHAALMERYREVAQVLDNPTLKGIIGKLHYRTSEWFADGVSTPDNPRGIAYKTEYTREEVLKKVKTEEAKYIIEELFRENAEYGSGSTADAVRYELATGDLCGGKSHLKKGRERMRQIKKHLRKRPKIDDYNVLQYLYDDLSDAYGDANDR